MEKKIKRTALIAGSDCVDDCWGKGVCKFIKSPNVALLLELITYKSILVKS